MSDANSDKPAGESTQQVNYEASHVARQWKHAAPMLGCRYDPTGRYVFAASMDFTIQRWDPDEDTHASFTGHESWLRGLGFSPDGQSLYSAGYDGKLCFWDALAKPGDATKSIEPSQVVQAHEGWIRWLAVHPNGKWIATAGNDLHVKLWSTESAESIKILKGHEKHIYSLLFHPNGELLFSGDLNGVVNQWDLATGKLVRSFDAKPLHTYHGGQQVDYGGVRCIALSHDGRQLACGGLHKATNPFAGVQEPLVVVFDFESAEQIRTHEATEIPRGIVWRLIYEADGTLIGGIGGQEGFLVFWREAKTEFHKFKLPDTALDMDRHPSAPELVTAHHDHGVRITRMTAQAS